jgi:tetratricopeptide (TPR) repeat protein
MRESLLLQVARRIFRFILLRRITTVIRRLTTFLAVAALAVALCAPALGQEHAVSPKSKSATLMTGFGDWHHPVSTENAQAQAFFDQGLRLIYAFNHDEAARSFQRATELDPKLAMAFWGIAEAVGPNYNDPASEDRYLQAHQAIEKAASLADDASESDRAYIAALSTRFPADPKSDLRLAAEGYRDAMRQVMLQFPDDLDAATLFAEAGMNLHPWGLWHMDGSAEEGTEEIVATLESVMRRDPNHMGAVHYYIHAVEASNSPQRALAGANRLAQLAPAAGHIVHMPAHIYIRTGDYEEAVKTNQKAAAADQAYLAASGEQGIYPMMYYSHNLHFIAMAAAMNGNYQESKRGAQKLAANVGPHVKEMPALEGFMTVPLAVEVRFHKWNEILKTPQPDAAMHTSTVFWHFARGLALASAGRLQEAEAEHAVVAEAEEKTPPDLAFQMPINNKTKDILKIAENVLSAKISLARNDVDAAVTQLREAVSVQDTLKYDEPEDWFYPVRESLGAALLKAGDHAGAEQVFRADLERHPRNPRSLFGLEQALKEQGKTYDAGFVHKQFEASWKATTAPTVDDLV